eukprot:GFKZ01003173.1.p1 GENE.GFKZ01003173.1~~GFKZ01003173.1.p1  ORF type:complete len:275 (-),score=41.52 GFKZ01003173.1:1001-1825(-)
MPHSIPRRSMLAYCALSGTAIPAPRSSWLGCPQHALRQPQDTHEVEAWSTATRRVVIHCGRRGGSRGGGTFRPRGDGRRPNRVAEMIRREMSGIIDDEYSRAFSRDEATSSVLVSVVDVKCSDDLRHARVSVSVMGTEDQKDRALRWLKSATRELRFKLAQCVKLKYMPQLSFTESELAKALKTMTILEDLAKERELKQGGAVQATAGVSAYAGGKEGRDDDLILDDLDMEGIFDIEDDEDDDDSMIVEVGDGEEDLADMTDSELKRALYHFGG